ncbi:MAG: transposase [Actinobacteria bacterium]|nr:transposase [Actinomycetota bacterium]
MERDEFLRAAWRVMVAGALAPQRLVFVDEMGANTALCPLYAWSKRGERVRMKAPRNRGPNTTLLSSMSTEGMGPCLEVEGSTNAVVFETYIEKILTPTLGPGQVVVMDNLSAHKGQRVKELIERQGSELLYLPSYSPDLKSHRGSLRQDQGHPAKSRGSHPRDPGRGYGIGDLGDQPPRCSGLL